MNKYEQLSYERKRLQQIGEAPEWYTTHSYQLLTEKNYLQPGETPKDMYERIANRTAELTKKKRIPVKDFGYRTWFEAFFDIMWKGWLSPSTPVLSNMGTSKNHPVSCSGSFIPDSIRGFYETRMELAQLTQRGYGTSVTLDAIRPRGSKYGVNGIASGIMPVAKGIVQDMIDISQGATRRGSCGMYLNIMHPDYDELIDQILADDEGWNIGINFDESFEELIKKDPIEADRRWKKLLKARLTKGKGYMLFLDKVNKANPKMYKERNLSVKHSNLCSEIMLFDDEEHSFTCVLSSLNIAKYDEWKDTDLIKIAMVFLDAVIDDMLEKAKKEKGFEKVVRFTERTRAVGLGVLGLSTYYQQKGWVFGDVLSSGFNHKLFKELDEKTLKVSKYLAEKAGEPEYMKGYGERFSHRLSMPPTMSTSIIMGGVSQGIEPVFANVYEHDTAGGTIYRINPTLIPIMKERGVYTKEAMKDISEHGGSVQHVDWLNEDEKKVFRTAFEIDQNVILRMASERQKFIDQGQSLNLYFPHDTPEEYIAEVHWKAYKDPYIKALYYVRTTNGKYKVTQPKSVCESCEG